MANANTTLHLETINKCFIMSVLLKIYWLSYNFLDLPINLEVIAACCLLFKILVLFFCFF